MKKQILSLALVLGIVFTGTVSNAAVKTNSTEGTPQEKITKDFSADFSAMPTITLTGKGFIASSVVEGHQVSAAYNKKGNKVYSVVRYSADNLEKNIVDIVKTNYDKYFITSMEKVEAPGFKPVFIVHLTDANSIKTVRVSGDATELLQNFKKI